MDKLTFMMNVCDGIKREIFEHRLVNAERETGYLLKQLNQILLEKGEKAKDQDGQAR